MKVADRVVVATDSKQVADAAQSAGAEVALTRQDHPSGTDRVAEVAFQPAFEAYDIILNVQGDEPFVSEEALRAAAAFVQRGTYDVGTAAFVASPDILNDPSVVKVVSDAHDRVLYFSRAPVPFLRDAGDADVRGPFVKQHVGVYAYSRAALGRWVSLPPHPLEVIERLEQLRPLADGLAMGVATVAPIEGAGIDTEADLMLANQRWFDTTPTVAGTH